jgi:hypothetical protein
VSSAKRHQGDSIRTLETRYKKYFPSDDDLEIPGQEVYEALVDGISSTFFLQPKAKVERNGDS